MLVKTGAKWVTTSWWLGWLEQLLVSAIKLHIHLSSNPEFHFRYIPKRKACLCLPKDMN